MTKKSDVRFDIKDGLKGKGNIRIKPYSIGISGIKREDI